MYLPGLRRSKTITILRFKHSRRFLSTDKTDISSQQTEFEFDLRYFEFKYIPVELISRLYEEFLGEDKQEKDYFIHLLILLNYWLMSVFL